MTEMIRISIDTVAVLLCHGIEEIEGTEHFWWQSRLRRYQVPQGDLHIERLAGGRSLVGLKSVTESPIGVLVRQDGSSDCLRFTMLKCHFVRVLIQQATVP